MVLLDAQRNCDQDKLILWEHIQQRDGNEYQEEDDHAQNGEGLALVVQWGYLIKRFGEDASQSRSHSTFTSPPTAT